MPLINCMEDCNKCDGSFYKYSDGEHMVSICYKCGNYKGYFDDDSEFIEQIMEDPSLLLYMIKDKTLLPV